MIELSSGIGSLPMMFVSGGGFFPFGYGYQIKLSDLKSKKSLNTIMIAGNRYSGWVNQTFDSFLISAGKSFSVTDTSKRVILYVEGSLGFSKEESYFKNSISKKSIHSVQLIPGAYLKYALNKRFSLSSGFSVSYGRFYINNSDENMEFRVPSFLSFILNYRL